MNVYDSERMSDSLNKTHNLVSVPDKADAILFLSLISGRNAEMLIGKQVITAPILKNSSIEIMSTGYMLIDSGKATTASYMSNTNPIPHNKDAVATCTAMAGEMLGLKLIFLFDRCTISLAAFLSGPLDKLNNSI